MMGIWTHNPPARSHDPRQYIHNISLFQGHLAQAPLISAAAGEKPLYFPGLGIEGKESVTEEVEEVALLSQLETGKGEPQAHKAL